ncbi:MAG TPA: AAA family ATPase [Candidatus Moranbacteria bacterium]|nr:AAA family ATPase [Candidatus Moranbacteria bacterium]HAT74940.1 AAA family ATPase [Candidatus Moranbacteria bacterium]
MRVKRYLHNFIASDLKEKMVFIGGPRQVGKTTLAKQVGESEYKQFAYLNWDKKEDKQKIIKNLLPAESRLIIFDEIHKYRQWKNYLKGEYDKNKDNFSILATGSARMDIYRRGGDSLMGRYHYLRLHPFSLGEAAYSKIPEIIPGKELAFQKKNKLSRKVFDDLFRFGGFPEPFIKKDEIVWRRFQNERLDRLIKEDIRDLETIRDLSSLQILAETLPEKIGSLFSLNSLREDLQAAHKTVALWMDVLERFYYQFRIYPFSSSAIRSLRKEPKLYLWDWSQIKNDGARMENMIASHLLKTVHFLHDCYGFKAELSFLRDKEGREVDFLVSVDKKPWLAVEVKLTELEISKHLRYFSGKLKVPFVYQVVKTADIDFIQDGIRLMSAEKFLSGLI